MIDIRRLEVLRSVVQQGSFSAAARVLRLSPSAVSQQMASLEREVGLTLLARAAGHGAQLTAAGEVLAGHAEQILVRLQAAELEMSALASQRSGRLCLATFASVAATLVPPAMVRLRSRFPDLDLEVVVLDPEESVASLRAETADLALITEVPAEGPEFEGVTTVPVLDDEFLVLLPATHRLRKRRHIDLRELAGEHWIMGSETGVCPDARIFRKACGQAGFTPRVTFRSADYPAVQGLVAAGMGLSFIPRLAVAGMREDVVAVRLSDPVPFRRVVAAMTGTTGERPAVVDGFVGALRSAADGHGRARAHPVPT